MICLITSGWNRRGFHARGGSAAPVLRWTSMTQTTEQRITQLKGDFPMAE